jgi:hypothetical protein
MFPPQLPELQLPRRLLQISVCLSLIWGLIFSRCCCDRDPSHNYKIRQNETRVACFYYGHTYDYGHGECERSEAQIVLAWGYILQPQNVLSSYRNMS